MISSIYAHALYNEKEDEKKKQQVQLPINWNAI